MQTRGNITFWIVVEVLLIILIAKQGLTLLAYFWFPHILFGDDISVNIEVPFMDILSLVVMILVVIFIKKYLIPSKVNVSS
jgi:hypothetical protein